MQKPDDRMPVQESPQQAVERVVKSVLAEVYQHQDTPPEISRRARQLAYEFNYTDATYTGPQARRAAGREYDEWIDAIFRSVQNGEWRENLLSQFIGKLGRFMEQGKSDALFALVIEEINSGKEFVRYRLSNWLGTAIHAEHWRNYALAIQDGKDRGLFRALIDGASDQIDIGVWFGRSLTDVYPYDDEFDSLINAAHPAGRHVEPLDAVWLSALSLKSEEADQPNRLLFIVYNNLGTAASPKIGRAAAHEWRIMQLLRIAYRQLDHEINHLGKRILAHRADIIRDLGPGFLAHELHAYMANQHEQHIMLGRQFQDLLARYPEEPALLASGTQLIKAIEETSSIFKTVHAYNNLMRARINERFNLFDVIDQATALVRVRINEYAKAKLQLERQRALSLSIVSDQGLILVVLVNILLNACHAIYAARQAASDPPAGGDRIVMLVESEPNDAQVILTIANTGPAIPAELTQRIFARGFTTRPDGHGQGLYLCRQILEYLGGGISTLDPQLRGLFPGAAFRIEFNREKIDKS